MDGAEPGAHCKNHPARSPVARCPSCGALFCGECVSEHGGRVLCRACLAHDMAQRELAPSARPGAVRWWEKGLALLSLAMVWFGFYLMGRILVSIPAAYHDGAIWSR